MRHSRTILMGKLLGAFLLLLSFPHLQISAGEVASNEVTTEELVGKEVIAPARQVLFLQTNFVKDFPENRQVNLLGRELIRQTILFAAREELGIPTFDQTLGENPPENAQVIHLFVRVRTKSKGRQSIRLSAYLGEEPDQKWKTIWKKNYDFGKAKHARYTEMVPQLEEDSRKELVEALLAAGFKKQQPHREPAPPVENSQFETMLSKIDFIAQFGAVRSAHQAIAANGVTPEMLGILVRGYTNLAFLTRHQYNATSQAFTARSWLYAQRLMVTDKQSEQAFWHRAYAWALGGTLQNGLTDLEQRKTIQRENSKEEPPIKVTFSPPWIQLIEPYCKSDRTALQEVGRQNDAINPWATRLWFDLTCTYQHDTWTFHAGTEVLELSPTAYGVYAEMSRSGAGLLTGRAGAFRAPVAFGHYFPGSLDAVPEMPKEVRAFLPTNAFKRYLLTAIFKDPAPEDSFSPATTYTAKILRNNSTKTLSCELSWSALAYLLEEEQFVQMANYLGVSTNATEHSLAEVVEGIYPLIKEHRYAAYVDSFRYNKRLGIKEIEKSLAGMTIEDPRGNMRRMFRRIWSVGEREGRGLGN